MALVKCPECGRENVSDNAESCPDCGYGIKAHFDKIKEEERAQQEELEKQKQHEERLKAVVPPEKPKLSIGFIIYVILASVGIYHMSASLNSVLIWLLEMFTFVLIPIWFYKWSYNDTKAKYELSQKNFDEYRRQVVEQYEEGERRRLEEQKEKEAEELAKAQGPECPYCHSHNLQRITTTSRVVSVGVAGLASKKIGKQWHCNNCNSDF